MSNRVRMAVMLVAIVMNLLTIGGCIFIYHTNKAAAKRVELYLAEMGENCSDWGGM